MQEINWITFFFKSKIQIDNIGVFNTIKTLLNGKSIGIII